MLYSLLCTLIHSMCSQETCSISRKTRWTRLVEYSIKQQAHGSTPLFSNKGASKTLLNEFFFYVLSKVSSWQCMNELRVTNLDDVESLLLHSLYGLLPQSKSEIKMPKVLVVSRYFVAYLASFVAVAPGPAARASPGRRHRDVT